MLDFQFSGIVIVSFLEWGETMLFEVLYLDLDMNTLFTLNVSICIGILLSLVFIHRTELAFGAPFTNNTEIQNSLPKKINKNSSLLIQYFITKRITRSIRNKVFTNDDAESSVSSYF